jgi:sensor c-di-GMP phosphodiesterase-like protein
MIYRISNIECNKNNTKKCTTVVMFSKVEYTMTKKKHANNNDKIYHNNDHNGIMLYNSSICIC